MADAVTSQTLMDGERMAIMKFTNIRWYWRDRSNQGHGFFA